MAKKLDNRNLNKAEDDANLQEILNDADDEIPIEEDVATKNNDIVDEPEDDQPGKDEEIEKDLGEEDDPDAADITETVDVKTALKKEEPDYKEKFRASSSEASTQYFKNKQMQEKIDEAAELPEPTIEELHAEARSKGTAYDELDEFAQGILKDSLMSKRQFALIKEANDAGKRIDVWAKDVDTFTNSVEVINKYPSLEGSEADFKKYAMKQSRRGMDMEDLLSGFLFQRQGDDPVKRTKPRKKDMLLSGGGGGTTPTEVKKIDAEELRIIRNTNPTRYKQLIKDGKIGLDILDAS